MVDLGSSAFDGGFAADEPTIDSNAERVMTGRKMRRGFVRRHKLITTFFVLITLSLASVVGAAFYLNSKLGNIATYTSKLSEPDRVPKYIPKAASSTSTEVAPVNILLMGADKSSGQSIAQLVKEGKWDYGSMRSDTMMLIHIPADRSHIYITSIPRDSWVPVPGHGITKINAAFSYGGPDLAVQTVEQLTNVHIDHVIMLDWDGFKGFTDALGGVTLDVPGQGEVKMDGADALAYVRVRKTLPNGDFDRIKRQQNFLRAIMTKAVDNVSFTSVGRLLTMLDMLGKNVTVDSTLTPAVMRGLAWDLRGIKSGSVTFMTAPVTGTGMEGDQSVVYLDPAKDGPLWQAIRADTMSSYVATNSPPTLPPPDQIN